ncbi:recombinase [Sedimentitalea sp. CY04]|uniref:Recombinase n=1 Tax=Parasedimentitalea denitrificans TaxID=2211118 RepID=A0ABX0WBZ0_9RHOB|nr:cytochrome P460 family protein [Sedimentitalea sp. CY04]NIZ63191.1 recombinase [Sedimentitalea sp. CY04]
MNSLVIFAVLIAVAIIAGTTAQAQDCQVSVTDPFDLTESDIARIYDCIGDRMVAAYSKGGDTVAKNYRGWTVTATRHVVDGTHGNGLLLTYANDIAAEQYLKFAEQGVVMPVGSQLAKESIRINATKNAAEVGPLTLMTKLETGASPETGDWLYGGIQPNGDPMRFQQASCHDCHKIWEGQDYLGYPIEEVRIGN